VTSAEVWGGIKARGDKRGAKTQRRLSWDLHLSLCYKKQSFQETRGFFSANLILWQWNKKIHNQNSLYSIFKKYWLKITTIHFCERGSLRSLKTPRFTSSLSLCERALRSSEISLRNPSLLIAKPLYPPPEASQALIFTPPLLYRGGKEGRGLKDGGVVEEIVYRKQNYQTPKIIGDFIYQSLKTNINTLFFFKNLAKNQVQIKKHYRILVINLLILDAGPIGTGRLLRTGRRGLLRDQSGEKKPLKPLVGFTSLAKRDPPPRSARGDRAKALLSCPVPSGVRGVTSAEVSKRGRSRICLSPQELGGVTTKEVSKRGQGQRLCSLPLSPQELGGVTSKEVSSLRDHLLYSLLRDHLLYSSLRDHLLYSREARPTTFTLALRRGKRGGLADTARDLCRGHTPNPRGERGKEQSLCPVPSHRARGGGKRSRGTVRFLPDRGGSRREMGGNKKQACSLQIRGSLLRGGQGGKEHSLLNKIDLYTYYLI
jgi:hypothetical protein